MAAARHSPRVCPMPWTLYRYILKDLLRVIGLTTLILVTVIAFGATIKPLANDVLLDAFQTAKYLCLAIVPMLQFALPFAAGFGTTLSFFRLTTDNEIQAMAASGISYWRILLPVVGLGIALMILMIVLTQSVIPQFWSMIVQTLATDVTRAFQVCIDRGEPFQMGRLQVYADRLVVSHAPEGPNGPDSRMFLVNVAAAELDAKGRVETDVTAVRAVVDIYRREDQTYLKMVMTDAVALNAQTGHLVWSERFEPPRPVIVPSPLRENPKALTRAQMIALRKNPDGYGPVIRAKRALGDAIQDARMRFVIDARLRSDGQLQLIGSSPGDASIRRRWVVHATRMTPEGRFAGTRDKGIEIIQFEGDNATLRFEAESAQLTPAANREPGPSLFDLELGNHKVNNLRQQNGAANQRGRLVLSDMRLEDTAYEDYSNFSSDQLLAQAGERSINRDLVKQKSAELTRAIRKLNREITGRLLNRYALSATALLLLALGALLPMWLRNSYPLTTYVLAFLPSVADLILISAGEQLLRDGRALGHGVMWSGNVMLLAMCVYSYWRVSRH